jgi:hypothetical protein
VVIYTIRITNPIIGKEIMKIETDEYALALMEAAHLSRLHGIAEVYDNSAGLEVARFRYGVEEFNKA